MNWGPQKSLADQVDVLTVYGVEVTVLHDDILVKGSAVLG